MIQIFTKDSKRKQWVDELRGIAMLLVLYGHLIQGSTPYFTFTSPIKLPLFLQLQDMCSTVLMPINVSFGKNCLLE